MLAISTYVQSVMGFPLDITPLACKALMTKIGVTCTAIGKVSFYLFRFAGISNLRMKDYKQSICDKLMTDFVV